MVTHTIVALAIALYLFIGYKIGIKKLKESINTWNEFSPGSGETLIHLLGYMAFWPLMTLARFASKLDKQVYNNLKEKHD